MSKRFITILIVVILLLVIVTGFYLLVFQQRKPKVIDLGQPGESPVGTEGGQLVSSPPPGYEVDQEDLVKNQLQRQAKYFLESYLTYSNQVNYLNLEELLPMMTSELQLQIKEKIRQGRAEQRLNQPYYGLTTKVIAIKLDKYQENNLAEFFASLQQQETKENETKIFYQNAKIVIKKEAGKWKVDEIEIK